MRKQLKTWVWIAASIATAPMLRADQAPRSANELTPPSEQEWHLISMALRQCYECKHCCAKPLLVYREVYYFPRPAPAACGEGSHRSFRGTYGVRHPMPYYIKEPKFDPQPKAPWQCRSCAIP